LLLDKFSSEDTDILLRRYGLNPETLPRGVLALSSRPYMARLFAEWNRLIGSVPDPNDGEAFVKFVFGDTEIPEELTVAHRAGLTPDDRETLFKILDMFYTPNGCKDTLPKAQLSAADENRDAWSAIISSGFLIERALPYGVEVTVNPDFREPLQVACERWREFAKRPAQPTAQPTTPQIKIEPTTLWSHQTEGSVYDMAMSDDGEYVAAGSEDGKIYFFNKGGKLLWSHKTGSPVGRVTITTDGDYVAAATKDGKIYILDKDGKLLWSHEVSFGSAHHMAMSPDGDHVAAAGSKGEIYFFGKDRKLLWSHHNTGGPAANGLAMMTMDEEYRVVAAFNDGNICIFDKDGKQLWSHETGGAKLPEPVKMAAMMTVKPSNSVAITTGEDNMAAAATDGKIYYFDFFEDKEGKPVWSYEIGGLLHDVAISRDGEYVAAVPTSDDAKIYFFDKSGKLLWSRKTVGETYVAISGDGKYVAAASSDHRVYFLDKTGNVLWSHQTGGPVNRVSISWDGEYVAAASSDHSVYFFLAWSGWG
jgi:WD40 repeat protein